MKVLCKYSGILFKVEHFPFTLDKGDMHHPVFDIPQKKLISVGVSRWPAQLGEVDSYLLYLALFNSTGNVTFRSPARYTDKTKSIIATNLPQLLLTIGRLNVINSAIADIPNIVITADTADLYNSDEWIKIWNSAIDDYISGAAAERMRRNTQIREEAIMRILRSNGKETTLAAKLAEWAADAASFPAFQVKTMYGDMKLSEYWKIIIRKAVSAEAIFQIPEGDIKELIEHLEENLDHGTPIACSLMEIVRTGLERNRNFLGEETSFVLMRPDDPVMKSNLELLIKNAPEEEPRREQFQKHFDYLKARARWELKQQIESTSQSPQSEFDL